MMSIYNIAIEKIPCHSGIMSFSNNSVAQINKLISKELYIQWRLHRDRQRAAKWVKQEYSMTTSVTAILNNLEWNLLSKHLQYSRLTVFFKFLHQDPPVIRITHYLPSTLTHYMWHTHHLHQIPPSTSTTNFQKSFFPRTITDQNNLPDNITISDTLYHFTLSLKSYNYN